MGGENDIVLLTSKLFEQSGPASLEFPTFQPFEPKSLVIKRGNGKTIEVHEVFRKGRRFFCFLRLATFEAHQNNTAGKLVHRHRFHWIL